MADSPVHHLQARRGDTWSWVFRYRVGGDASKVVDMRGCSARLQVRERLKRTVVAAAGCPKEEFPEQGTMQLDWWLGEVRVKFPATITMQVPADRYDVDLEVIWPDGSVSSTKTVPVHVYGDITICDYPPVHIPLVRHLARKYVTADDAWYMSGADEGYVVGFDNRQIYLTSDGEWYLSARDMGYMTYHPRYEFYRTADDAHYLTGQTNLHYQSRKRP